MKNDRSVKVYLGMAILFALAEILVLAMGYGELPISGILLFLTFLALSLSVKNTEKLKGLTFTFQIFAFISLTLYFPKLFLNWGFDTKLLVVPSIQVIMFGMGTKLNLGDFAKEISRPLKVIVGTAMVFVLMPLTGVLLLQIFNFPPEVAAGIILVSACPGGVASNVMTYLAKGNLVLSLTVTTLTTLLSPIVTPFLMLIFAGQYIKVDAVNMMISIVNMILVPIFAGIIINKIIYGDIKWFKKDANMILIAILCFLIGFGLIFVSFPAVIKALQSGLILIFWAVTVVSVTIVVIRRTNGPANWMDIVLPKISLGAIMLYIIIVAAQNQAILLTIGPALIFANIILNTFGFVLGFGTCKILRFSDEDTRALTIETASKNAGLAVGLAYDVLRSQAAALVPLIYGTWMNISASSLASFWGQRLPKKKEAT